MDIAQEIKLTSATVVILGAALANSVIGHLD